MIRRSLRASVSTVLIACALTAGLLPASPQRQPAQIDYDGLQVILETGKVHQFADRIPCTISLVNQANSPKRVFTLDDANMDLVIMRILPPGTGETSTAHLRKQPKPFPVPGGFGFPILEQQTLLLGGGQRISRQVELTNLWGFPPPGGTYRLTLTYEGRLTTEELLEVVFEGERDLPKLISLFEAGNKETRRRVRGAIQFLTGQLRDYGMIGDTPELAREAAEELRSWWVRSKSELELVNGRLVKKGR